eukprot:CAMPEP_0198685986 /NCGR_PEP_ID=MMETSP1468-20131203/14345_1 /TAXON_ID=1461545 /ORGANISM="Mantoniella sp, Strain CCMP1436" /LENGTH=41 /DNA_ID= /DNA_START= /DNA_END= /DNA_ORIENTATION=
MTTNSGGTSRWPQPPDGAHTNEEFRQMTCWEGSGFVRNTGK